ncbi:hypothetical protein D3C72_1931980 [compost metagenome]
MGRKDHKARCLGGPGTDLLDMTSVASSKRAVTFTAVRENWKTGVHWLQDELVWCGLEITAEPVRRPNAGRQSIAVVFTATGCC